ncbi:MAG TPA: hypothetical protein VN950_19200 [Terriglobales bacterium]|nr:hypothetical protein [Terriglobales bacterium]
MTTEPKYQLWKAKPPGEAESYHILPVGHAAAVAFSDFMEKMPWTAEMEAELLEALERSKKPDRP